MGKTTCSDWLIGQGFPVVDTDEISRELTRGDAEVLAEIRSAFGDEVFDEESQLIREKLALIVFADDSQRRILEDILHPRIRQAWKDISKEWEHTGKGVGFVVIPLLYETKAEESFDAVVCVACTTGTQRQRLEERGWSAKSIEGRSRAQLPVKEKMLRADFVIWTEGRKTSGEQQMKMVLRHLAG